MSDTPSNVMSDDGAIRFQPLDHPILFREPRRLSDFSIWRGHIPFAMLLIELAQPAVLVELGTHYGDSYSAFCQAVQELELPTRCTAVDTWQGDPQAGFYDTEILDDLRSHHDPLYSEFSTLLQSTFDDAASQFADGSIDLLHIDGLHTYDAVRHDFETWLPKMSERGIVLLHDTAATQEDFGVYQLWDDLTTRYPHFAFTHASGLGMIAVGSTYPAALRFFFEANTSETERLCTLFAFLGERHLFQGARLPLLKEVNGVRAHLQEVEEWVAVLTKARAEELDRLYKSDAQVATLSQRVTGLEQEVSSLKTHAENLSGTIAYMEGSPFWKLRNRLHALRRRVGLAGDRV